MSLLTHKPRILALGGSLRAGSFNQKMAALAAEAARTAGAEVTLISLRDYRLPLFDEDLEAEEGMPEAAKALKALFCDHDAFIIASPEYNGTYTAALKNAIDWASRATTPNEAPLLAFNGKTTALLAASPGGYGGVRGLVQLRAFLENIRMSVMPDQVLVPKAHEAFDASGNLVDAELSAAVQALSASLVVKLIKSDDNAS